MKAALYARVSSEEQVEGYSIDAQKRAFQSLAKSKGWETYREYVDEGKSARTDNINKRPAFKEMINDALAGQFDVVVVHKLDRFARNLRITLEYFDKLAKADISFVSMNENMDFSTPWGRLALTLLGGLAQFYSDNLSQETKKGWHERREQGLYCGTLPFGAMKDECGVPVADMQERKTVADSQDVCVRNYEGLKIIFDLAGQGKSDKEIAIAINASGYRTTGTHGSRPFSKDTIKNILNNRFYVGFISDGNQGWQKAKHKAFVDKEVFEAIQEARTMGRSPRQTINAGARVYSLSYVAKCARCGGSIRMQTNHKGRARVYCASKSEGLGCDFVGTFLDAYESQIEWYLADFVIPENYQTEIMQAHTKLTAAYDDTDHQREVLKASVSRLKDQYRWGHISQSDYLREYHQTETQLQQLGIIQDRGRELQVLAHFLTNVANAWRQATQEQRNKLARTIFDEIKLDSGGQVVGVKPRPEFEPFFKLSYECHKKDIGCDPGGLRTLICNTPVTLLNHSATASLKSPLEDESCLLVIARR